MKKIDERTFEFALDVVSVYKFLIARKEYVLSKQVLRSGTSIGANVQEAQAAQSRPDFISKMCIASKEARETLYWIRLLIKSNYLQEYPGSKNFRTECENIVNILTRIVKTTKQNTGKQ